MRWIAGVLVALVFLAVGYALGRTASNDEPKGRAPSSDLGLSASQTRPPSSEFLAALRSALQETRLLERTLHSAGLLSQLSAEDAAQAIAVFESEGAEQPLIDLLVDRWVRLDGQDAFEHFRQKPEFVQQQTLPRLLKTWASFDPQAAQGAYATLERKDAPKLGPAARRGDTLLAGLLEGWAISGQPGLTAFFFQQTGGSKLSKLASFFLRQRATQDGFDATADFADQLASNDEYDRSFKKMMLEAAGAALAGLDSQRAGSWARKYAGDPLAFATSRGVATKWAAVEPAATMRWLASLPEDKVRDRLVDTIYGGWLRRRSEAAMEWAAQADSSVALEPAIAQYATALATTDPQSAVVQAGSITNAERRTKALIDIAQVWYQADPGPATAWLEQSELDDEQRAQAVARAGKGGKRARKDRRQSARDRELSGMNRRM